MSTSPDKFSDSDFEFAYRHRPMVVAYCQRRGSRDPEGLSAETFAIAWEKRSELNKRDCRPWLIATARNLLYQEYRMRRKSLTVTPDFLASIEQHGHEVAYEIESLNPEVDRALRSLSREDREALLLVAWDELTPTQAAGSLGISAVAFRVRLHRARQRFIRHFEAASRPLPVRPELDSEPRA